MDDSTLVLGAGMTGLAAGLASGAPVLEAEPEPGGICCSYYLTPGADAPRAEPPADDEAYRFENGGGHWLFGGDPGVLRFVDGLAPLTRYARRSSVYFPDTRRRVSYPIQNHLRELDPGLAAAALSEMARPAPPAATLSQWLEGSFGETLCGLFFEPFHQLYTAGLCERIAPQDAHKSPVDLQLALRGAFQDAPAVGYNVTFAYPEGGLDALSRRMAQRCRVELGCRVASISTRERVVHLADGSSRPYETLLSTLPLNRMLEMTGLTTEAPPDPFTSVLVLNVGGLRGEACPDDHWLYVPHSECGFHRVGFYSNVDPSFLPASARDRRERVSLYVERAFAPSDRPSDVQVDDYARRVVEELRQWGFLSEAEVVHPTWIDVAYTWSWPGSSWRSQALRVLEENGVIPVGRYGRWHFQGIVDSIRDGFVAGSSVRRYEKL